MEQKINILMEEAIWTAHQLFARNLVTGSTGNISFKYQDCMYISKSGSCFGRIDAHSFSKVTLSGKILEGKPSKEFPIHLALYIKNEDTKAVIHTHSLYSTATSCEKDIQRAIQRLYSYTPYLNILTKGCIGYVPYHAPGSSKLFASFEKCLTENTNTYLLCNHGVVVAANTMYHAFDIIEEFEVSAKLQSIAQVRELQELQRSEFADAK